MLSILLLSSITVILLISFYRKRSKLPPGPFPLPIIGNIHQFGWMLMKYGGVVNALKEWKKPYGPVFTIWLGPQPTVHVCSMEVAQETMIKRGNLFVDRWLPIFWQDMNEGLGIIGSKGNHWAEQRRFALHTLRNFGLGRGIMEDRIMMELNHRTKFLNEEIKAGRSEVDAQHFFYLTVASIVNRMLFNERLEKDDEKLLFALKKEADNVTANFGMIDSLYDYPILRKIPFLKKRWDPMVKALVDVKEFLRKQVAERMEAIEKGDHVISEDPEDYVDAYLVKMNEEKKQGSTTFTIDGLVINLWDLWSAGQDTTTITLQSAFYNFLQNPDVVEKVRNELLEVTGGERSLSLKDKPNTPYFNIVCTEIQRIASIMSLNIPRETKEDTVIEGHFVAKGTPIAAEISVLMAEDSLFDNPDKFDPSRYEENGDLEQYVLPFGLGKRACIGESLAKAEIYLITGNLILRYAIKKTNEPLPTKFETGGFIKTPPKYKMRLEKL